MDWSSFFPPGTPVLALPDWRNPRLYLPAQRPLQRWEQSSLYPASRPEARLYRLLLRLGAAARLKEVRTAAASGWPLGEFVRGTLPRPASVVVLMGTPGPAQKITAQLRDGKGRVLGYLKYAGTEAARRRLRQEWRVLSNLPGDIGPEPVKLGPLGDGLALLQSAVGGRALPAALPPPEGSTRLLDSLVLSPPMPLDEHPWVCRMRGSGPTEPEPWLRTLAEREWPVVIQHGDFAPWNLLRGTGGALRAIDWEYGALEGFPYLDLAFYILQTSALIYRRAPLDAARYAVEHLSGQPDLALSRSEALALTRLAAYDAYLKSAEDGHAPDTRLQAWRRSVWRG